MFYVLYIYNRRLVDMICEKMSDSLQDTLTKNANGGSIQDLNSTGLQRSTCSC